MNILGYTFTHKTLAEQALTHRSGHPTQHNERLEFLGDRVLNLAVAELLYLHYPHADEGELAKRHAALVREGTLAKIARQWNFGALLIMSKAETDSGGGDKDSILADAVEAMLAAIYLDGGLEPVSQIVKQYWPPLFDETPLQDAKTALQEWLQAQGASLPEYSELSATGPQHAREFKIEVCAGGFGTAVGQGKSKQIASQQAAAALLAQLTTQNEPE